jgi:hypothetical protein
MSDIPLQQLSTIDNDQEYRAVSRSAVASLLLGVLGLLGFSFYPMLLFPILAGVVGAVSLGQFRKYPRELTGKPLAQLGLGLGLATLAIAPAVHIYTYLTEVPEGYARVSFSQLKSPYIDADVPPPTALELDGKPIFLKGYILPSSIASSSVNRFVLVPDIATCCFGGQPKMTHMVEVTLDSETTARFRLRQVKLAGTFHVDEQADPQANMQGGFYQLKADIYRP